MSWANELYAVYEKAMTLESERGFPLPISHSTAKAQLEVTIDGNGNFLDAVPITDESDSVTIIPVTEDSGARANGISPHPFADKLIYIAGDYCEYCDAKKGDDEKFAAYIAQLKMWRDSEFTHPSVNALYSYLLKGTLISDLIKARVLTADASGKLTADKIRNIKQSDCFVRFIVTGSSDEERTWLDKTLYDKYIAYNRSLQADRSMCYATGDMTYCTYKHPSKVLNAGDKGKLFSANDPSGFSYRGRFLDKEQAFSIGYEFSQKMHNGLKWLIERQRVNIGSLTLVAWNSELDELPNICGSSRNLYSGNIDDSDDEWEDDDSFPETFASYSEVLKKSIFSTKTDWTPDQKAMILALDEATTGRVSVNMYRELPESDLFNCINKWHLDTAWNRYDFKQKKNYIGSFALPQIAEYAYGTEQSGKMACKPEIKGDIIARLIPCVTEGRDLPTDILRQLVNRTSRRTAYDKSWSTLLEITCGMIRKSIIEKGDDCCMALDKNCSARSYLFGRLLAIAEVAERSAYKAGEDRATNAERYFEKFSNSPAAVWEVISQRLSPYLNRMSRGEKIYYQRLIDEVMDKFDRGDFNDKSKLEPEFLLAYSCQRKELYTKKQNDNSEEV